MGFFDSVSTQPTGVGTPPVPTTPTAPTTASPTSGGFFSSVKAPVQSSASLPKTGSFFEPVKPQTQESSTTPATSTPSPYFYKQFPSGATQGASDQFDTSGRPLLGYRNPGDTATSTDTTRVDTTFDPYKAQPLTHDEYYNPRAENLRSEYHDSMGIQPDEQLDHAMALSLGGSNQESNLRPLPTAENQAAGKQEADLAEQVRTGKISYHEAQVQEAKNKGLVKPWSPPDVKPGITFRDIFGNNKTASGASDLTGDSGFLGKAINDPSQEEVGKQSSPVLRTLMELPSSVAENLPLGIGTIVQQLKNDPETALNLSWDDVAKSLPDVAKEAVKNFAVSPILTVAGGILFPFLKDNGQIKVNIPGLGEVSNLQANAAESISNGAPVWQTLLQSTPDAIFSSLMMAGLAENVFGPRQVTVASGEAPEGITVAESPKTGRVYNPPVTAQHIPTDIVQKISTEQGIDLNSKFDPKAPTYFRMSSDSNGNVTGQLVQIKPSYFNTFMNMFKGDASAAPDTAVVPFFSRSFSLKDISDSVQNASDYLKSIPNRQGGFVRIGPEVTTNEVEGTTGNNPEMEKVQNDATQYVKNNETDLVQQYHEQNGSVFNVDAMKDLIPGHTENPTISEAYHKPAAELMGKMVDSALESTKDQGKVVSFLAGATGAGKSTAIKMMSEGSDRVLGADMTIDGTSANNNRTADQVKHSLDTGHKTNMVYVENTPERIFDNIISRAISGGRPVPIEMMYNTLLKSRQSVMRLNGKFGSNPDFGVEVIDNRGSEPKIMDNGIDFLKSNPYSNSDIASFKEAAYAKAQNLYEQGKISEQVYRALTRGKPEAVVEKDSSINGGEHQTQPESRTPAEVKLPAENTAQTTGKIPEIYSKFLEGDPTVEEELSREAEEMNVINQKHAHELIDLEEAGVGLEIRREALENNPARELAKYVAKSGEFSGRLPEVTGGKEAKSEFSKRGDDIVTELGFPDSETARSAWEKYKTQKDKFSSEMKAFQDRKRALFEKFREDAEKYGGATSHPAGRYDLEITEANGGIVPPVVRGGLQAPEMDLTQWKDLGAARLGRDTFERNIEKVAPQNATELKKFIVDPVRQNEVDKIHYVNDIYADLEKKTKDWKIKVHSDNDDLIQRYGEGYLSIEQLSAATPEWKEVMSAADYFRKTYDRVIDDWNIKRAKFGYSAVPKRADYFRHFNDINQFTNTFGFLRSESQLPTEIAGMSHAFKPGKPFSTAELHRIGNQTSYSAIRGMQNYIESVSRQMFHIDSVQRGRALEKYIRKVAKENRGLKLPNFVQNVQEWTNLVSGKAAMLDRAIESTVGRPVMKFMTGLANLIGRNIIVGNISVAMTHLVSLPLNLATVDKVPFTKGLLGTLVSPLKSEPITTIEGNESSFLTRRFPEKYIQPTKFDTLQETLSWLFKLTDMFKSKVTVASKYYEGLSNGLSETDAMKQADTYAGRIIGDYSTGNRPNLMSAHITKLFAQFQLGVNDSLSVLMHDIPEWEKGNKWKIGYRLVAFAVFSYLFNQLYKQLRGAGKGIDPIGAGLDLMGMTDESAGQDFFTRLKIAGGDIAGELPFTSIGFGSFPLATAVAQPLQQAITGPNRAAALESLASDIISPIGGGAQAKKTIEGIEAVQKGQTTTAKGQKNVTVEPTAENYLKGAIFGPSALNAASGANTETKSLINILNQGSGQISVQAEKIYNDLKNAPDGAAQFDKLKESNPALARTVERIATEDKEGMTLNERLIQKLGVSNGARAKYVAGQFNALTDQKAKADLWDRYVKLKIISPQVSEQLGPLIKK